MYNKFSNFATNMWKRYPFSLLLALCIVVVSLVPIPETPLEDIPFYDKWTHFLMYGALSLAAWWDYLRSGKVVKWVKAVTIAVVLPIVLSGLLELAQAYLTTCRNGDWLDFAANSVGVVLVTLCVCLYLTVRNRPS